MSTAARTLLLTGNHAVAWGARLARPQVVPVYPITPQTPVLEKLADFQAAGEFDAEILTPESERSVFKGRDGCRTPMPWQAATHAGFTSGTPWLPVADTHVARNLAAQAADPASTLNQYRRFLRWRARQPALIDGDIRFLDTAVPVLAFTRTHADQTLLCVFNLGAEAQSFALPSNRSVALADSPFTATTLDANTLQLPAHAACYLIAP